MTRLVLALAVVALLAGPSLAADLVAIQGTWTPPGDGATPVPMWGFAEDTGQECTSAPTWDTGVEIRALAGDNLTINLRNCLGEPVSIFIPGQNNPLVPVYEGNRMTSLTTVASPGGGTASYTWNGLKAGTYLYHSGANLAQQVQMGLYGSLIVDAEPGIAYNGADPLTYDHEVVLVYSEIDPALHETLASANPNNYTPRYFLVNGQPYATGAAAISAGAVGQTTLVRMLSACLDDIVPTLNGLHWDLVAEDGNRYAWPKSQYTALLSPLKTRDALLVPVETGTYAVFDRRLNLTNAGAGPGGMLAMLTIGGTAAAPIANDDVYSMASGTTLNIAAPGVLGNDSGAGVLSATLVTGPSNAAAFSLSASGSFIYTPNAGPSIADSFTYTASNTSGTSDSATVTINVTANAAPVAVSRPVTTNEDTPLPITLSATDADLGTTLTYSIVTPPANGILSGTPPSVTYSPAPNFNGSDSFTFKANDGLVDSNTATVGITVLAVDDPPVANPDVATTRQGTAVTINLTANDTDPDGNLNPASVVVPTTSTRGGSITNLGNGSVTYTPPRRNFRGTDSFTYTVKDSGTPPLTSNSATVTVNVVR
jgi:FtsP/CotA-like multicopper oxidase with cupredoxin domain